MNVLIISDCHSNEDIKNIVETLKSCSCFKPAKYTVTILGNFHPKLKEQVASMPVKLYPKTTSMGYLKLLMDDQFFPDDDWIILIKGGDLFIDNPFNSAHSNCDGFVGMQYLGSGKDHHPFPQAEKQTVDTINEFIKLHQNEIIGEAGLSGTAIRAKYLKKYFAFYETNESQLLQFIENLSDMTFLTSPIVYRKPCVLKDEFIPNEFLSSNKSMNILEQIELGDEIIRKSDQLMCLFGKFKDTQNEMILAKKENREPDTTIRQQILDDITNEMNSIFGLIVDNDLG